MELTQIQRYLKQLETFGVGGRVFNPASRQPGLINRDHETHIMDSGRLKIDDAELNPAYAATKAFLSGLASGTPPSQGEIEKTLKQAFEEIAMLKGCRMWGDPSLVTESRMHALAAARIEAVNNFVVARPNFKNLYFDNVTLASDEQPYIVNETKAEIQITSIGEDGTPQRNRFIKPQSRTPIGLFFLSSQIARVKTLDLYKGEIASRITSTLDISRDLNIEEDLKFWALVNLPATAGGCFGPFSYENGNAQPQLRVWQAHSAIDQTQFPETNDYDLTQSPYTTYNPSPVGNLTGFEPKVITAITDYCVRFDDIFDGPITFTGDIIMPPKDIANIDVIFLPVANAYEQKIQEQLNYDEMGFKGFNLYGKRIRLIPNLFITRGTCYPVFNRKPGISYTKPGLDRELVEVNQPENWEQRQMRKVYGAAIIAQRRQFVMRIKYSEASASSSTDSFRTFPYESLVGSSLTASEQYPTTS